MGKVRASDPQGPLSFGGSACYHRGAMAFRGPFSRHALTGVAALTASLALGHPAAAQSMDDRAGARAAAGEGTKALREGRWADAIDLFTRAESLVHALPHLLYMARAQVEVGMLVEARENLMRVSREALAPDAPHAFKIAQEEAAAEIKGVEARIPYVTVTIKGGGASDVGVTQDGNKIPTALIGVPRPVNPGQHTFEAVGSAGKATASITIKEAERQRLILDLASGSSSSSAGGGAAPPPPKPAGGDTKKPPPTEGKPAPTEAKAAAESSTPPPGKDAGPAPEPESGGGSSGMRIGSYVAFGVGGLGLIAGTIFSLGAKSKFSDSNSLYSKNNCDNYPNPPCTDAIKKQIDDADSSASGQKTLGIVGFVLGGLGIAAGATLFVLSSGSSEKSAQSQPTLRVAGAPGFVSLTGTF